eukprot:CAMPEP_0174386792 /NCGR_PEP_ID=MMETSP0811_2-20130205/127517_1 /TAXON_ID=73025 ORGANISM="Eutreptiella gymnastica-like, Strain CCMP1594" /NCGR_SAMPLE_ID=MMETSP0811_2 /ASSEMBLY_ACC=CAM_ASM_000667 /LENGTH=63 /DNA_ID=CAMNT_0015541597 /DNA_START=626 /DNA_END=817 /DNA_ORIENTATION=-
MHEDMIVNGRVQMGLQMGQTRKPLRQAKNCATTKKVTLCMGGAVPSRHFHASFCVVMHQRLPA